MQILVNGQPRQLPGPLPLPALIESLKLEGRLAVELNGAIVPRSTWDAALIQEGDALEIVAAIGGG